MQTNIIYFYFLAFLGNFTKAIRTEDEQNLIEDLLHRSNYSVDSRPVKSPLSPVHVSISIALREIVNVNEKQQLLKTSIWMRLYWKDEFLKWNPADYAGIQRIHLPARKHWKPDIVLENNAADRFRPTFEDVLTPIRYDGQVKYAYPGIFTTTCAPDIKYFPFDQQICKLTFLSWAFNLSALDLSLSEQGADTNSFVQNSEWALVNMTGEKKVYQFGDEANYMYPTIHFNITMRRRPSQYIFYLVFPNILINVITVVQFWLPCDSGERVSLGITVVLSMVVYLLLLQNLLPMSEQMPLIGSYFAATTVWATLSLLLTFIILYIHHRDPELKMPRWCRTIFLHVLGQVLCVQKFKAAPSPALRVSMRKKSFETRRKIQSRISSAEEHNSRMNKYNPPKSRTSSAFLADEDYQQEAEHLWSKADCVHVPEGESTECMLLGEMLDILSKMSKQSTRPQTEWQELAIVVHRLLFWMYFSTMIITICIIFFTRPIHNEPIIK